MLIVLGLILFVAAVIVGGAGVLINGSGAHALTDPFAVFGYHVTGSTGQLFLYGIVVGAIGLGGLALLLAGARRTARRGRTARRDLKQSRWQTAAVSQDLDDTLHAQRRANTRNTDSTDHAASADGVRGWRRHFGHRPADRPTSATSGSEPQ